MSSARYYNSTEQAQRMLCRSKEEAEQLSSRLGDGESRSDNALEELLKLTESKADLVDTHYAIALFANVLDRPELEAEYLTNYLELAPEGSQADVGRRRLEELHRASTTSE